MITIDVAECRERNGSELEDRPDRVDEVLFSEKLGFKEGSPLVGESYSEYPDREDLANPSQGKFIRELLEHELVGSYADAVKELTGATNDSLLSDYLQAVEKAANLHNIDTDTAFENVRENPDTKEAVSTILDFDVHEDLIDSENPLFVSMLYVTGLSVSEIADVLDAKQSDTRDRLVRVYPEDETAGTA